MRISNEPMEVILSSYSVIYADYLTYYKILGLFKDYLDDSVKDKFVNNDIKMIYAKKRDELNVPKYAYGESFSMMVNTLIVHLTNLLNIIGEI